MPTSFCTRRIEKAGRWADRSPPEPSGNNWGPSEILTPEQAKLDHNQLTDVKGLEKLTQLKTLDLHDNKLTNVKGLEKLTKLWSLNLTGNPDLSKAQIDELQKALPKCKIKYNPTR